MKRKTRYTLYNCSLALSIGLWFLVCTSMSAIQQQENLLAKTYPIIPSPQEITYGEEEILFDGISIDQGDFASEALKLASYFKSQGIPEVSDGITILLRKKELDQENPSEAYRLQIDAAIRITAQTAQGAFYGVQTLKQLFSKKKHQGALPEIKISDWPVFKIRGFMHDTGRNFQSVEQLKEQIEVMARYKYNVFHWHLTDDPGWRLESKIYPELQADSTFSRGVAKFYSQEDFKDILAFCKERHITVIPEFDIPGHTAAFRKAMGIESMKDEKVLPVLLDLFDELCNLADASEMPYIHIGTDEVRNKEEYVSDGFILKIMNHLKSKNREIVVWKEGIAVKQDTTSIKQLWARHPPEKGHRFVDSRANYINHLDPFAGMSRLYFQQPCRQPKGDSLALGGILCAWPDNNVAHESDILKQNPIYPSLVFYSDAIWNGREKNHEKYWAKLPPMNSPEYKEFKAFEAKVLTHRDEFFKGKEFQYVKQSNIQWHVIGPFDHQGDVSKSFPVEAELKDSYHVDGQNYTWKDSVVGGTIHLKHFFGFPALTDAESGTYYAYTNIYSPNARIQDFWIGFQGWSRSGGRRGGPFPEIGHWHHTEPSIRVNAKEIAPPEWKQPNLGVKTDEIPFIDEDYFYRQPTKIQLKKGWNQVLLKIPHDKASWKWMFTCVPITITEEGFREVAELKFKTELNIGHNE